MPATDDPTRARLAKLVSESRIAWARSNEEGEESVSRVVADYLLKAGVTLPEPPAPVWPVTEEAVEAYSDAYLASAKDYAHYTAEEQIVRDRKAAFAAAAPHLWRAKVESLTDSDLYSLCHRRDTDEARAALLALAGGER